MKKSTISFLVILVGSIFISSVQLVAQWSTDPYVNNPICTTATQQTVPRIVSDGSGGAIITWWDYDQNTTGKYSIYAQRINVDGVIQWATTGVPICTNPGQPHTPEAASDGNGGAFIVWQDTRSGNNDIYAQRINSNGVVQWAANGIAVCDSIKDQTFPKVINDGNGNAIITWQDLRGGVNYTPYAQKLNSNGISQWYSGGVPLSPNTAETPQIISDGNGGAVITWHQYTGVYPNGNFDIIAQRVDAGGNLGWGNNGDIICSLTSDQLRPQLTSDGNNGAIIAWEDYRNGSYSNLYAQKVNSDGSVQWAADGVVIASNSIGQTRQSLLSDNNGGAYVIWQYVNLNSIRAQRIDSNGNIQWASDGISIGSSGTSYPQVVSDGAGGAIITWNNYSGDIFAQRIDFSGNVLWIVNGVGVCRAPSGQALPRLVEIGNGDVIITWEDARNSTTNSTDIYAQEVSSSGILGLITDVSDLPGAPVEFTLNQNYPNPFNPSTTISFSIPNEELVSLKVFNVIGEEVSNLVNENKPAGSYAVLFDASKLTSGIYFYKISAGNFSSTKKMLLLK